MFFLGVLLIRLLLVLLRLLLLFLPLLFALIGVGQVATPGPGMLRTVTTIHNPGAQAQNLVNHSVQVVTKTWVVLVLRVVAIAQLGFDRR